MEQNNQIDFGLPTYFFNRELSWLDFNKRVILEADDNQNPLLEKLNFLSIGSSNLDEFFMIRVAGLQDQLKFGYSVPDTKTQLTAEEQLIEIAKKNRENIALQYSLLEKLKSELPANNIAFVHVADLSESETEAVYDYFQNYIFPTLTPLGIDAYRPFPHLNNKLLHLFVNLKKDEKHHVAVVPISSLVERYYLVRNEENIKVVLLEDIITTFLDTLFVGYDIEECFTFRITRNADFEVHEEGADDLLSVIEDYLRQRKNGMAVRLEVQTIGDNQYFQENIAMLQAELELEDRDIYQFDGPLDLTVLSDIVSGIKKEFPHLVYPPFQPVIPRELLGKNLFQVIEQQDVFLHHPYDSFNPVVTFIRESASDRNTLAIKQTLYRVSSNSPIIAALKEAAENGIQVTVLLELKARFDEENNVQWAKELEEAGANVLYGVTELKTHSKITLVVKKKKDHILRYVHLGTGNYNDKTARGYEDMGIFTSNIEIAEDATAFFNYLSGFTDVPDYQHLYVSPFDIRLSFVDYVEKEIQFHKKFGNGRIIAKMNSLTDRKIIMKLYEASSVGIQIDLIIRGICCLRPGVEGVSENIRVRSIVGRFLEHSRIYYFHQNGKHHLFLSSADMMTRNMVKRVEIEFPILDAAIRQEIIDVLRVYLSDNTKARRLLPTGDYEYIRNDKPALSAQTQFMEGASKEAETRPITVQKTSWLQRIKNRFFK